MVLISQYSTQGSSAIHKLWSKEVKLRPFVTLQMVGRLNMSSAPFKGHSFTSRMPQHFLQRDVKHMKMPALGSSSQNKESGSIVSWNFEGEPPQGNASKRQNQIESREQRLHILKAMWHYFLGLIKTVLKIPKAILLLWYFVITVINGSEPTKEEIPLWVLGTITLCLCIKGMIMLLVTVEQIFDVKWANNYSRELSRFFE